MPMLVGFEHGKEGEYRHSALEEYSVDQRVLEWKLRMNGQVSSHRLYLCTVGEQGQQHSHVFCFVIDSHVGQPATSLRVV